MEKIEKIYLDFGCVPCGVKSVQTIKIENKSKKPQLFVMVPRTKQSDVVNDKLQIHPSQFLAQGRQDAKFTLSYISYVQGCTENHAFEVVQSEKVVALLDVHVQSVGPLLKPSTINLKFFRFQNVNQTSKSLEITNSGACDAKYFFDIDENEQKLEIQKPNGIIPSNHKLGLKVIFHPLEPGVYYKRIFCIVQFHEPLIFDILAVYEPKFKLEPKSLTFVYPPFMSFSNNYEAYLFQRQKENQPEEDSYSEYVSVSQSTTCESEFVSCETSNDGRRCWDEESTISVFLTKEFVNIGNCEEVEKATTLVNFSKLKQYYYEWDHDPHNNFQIEPCRGLIQNGTKTNFSISFTPDALDCLYHAELDVKIFPCDKGLSSPSSIYLPSTATLRIIGNSFAGNTCGWLPQCRIIPKVLDLGSCVFDEVVYGSFAIERDGHLPFSYVVDLRDDSNFCISPLVGFLSKDFQLLVVKFSSKSKKVGVYVEDVKIKFNNSDLNVETIKIKISIENPYLILGDNNAFTFTPLSPGSTMTSVVPIRNPTNLHLRYEFRVPEDIDWADIWNPIGSIEPKACGHVEVIFKPDAACEYLDYIPCYVSSVTKENYAEITYLQLIGSCQFGFLVATPSMHDFGETICLKKKSVVAHLYNFSCASLSFKLTPCGKMGNPNRDVSVDPERGCVSPKGNISVTITITPHEADIFHYIINCHNIKEDSEQAEPQGEPTQVFSLTFEGVFPTLQIIDASVTSVGPLFSPHTLWEMLNINKVNEALRSLDRCHVVPVHLPEIPENSDLVVLNLLMETNGHGEVFWDLSLNIICPDMEEIEKNAMETLQCLQKKMLVSRPNKRILSPHQRVVSSVMLNHVQLNNCIIELKMSLAHKKIILLHMPVTTLAVDGPSIMSPYLKSALELKSVFIGDPHPLVQLFWYYNNTNKSASYFLDNSSLRQSTAIKGIFNCVNPIGILPPFSAMPLGFVFSPTEMTSYETEVSLYVNTETLHRLTLKGDGILSTQPSAEIIKEKPIPTLAILSDHEVPLKCSVNAIEIPYLRTFSTVKRVFFVKNTSSTNAWSFHWHRFSAENLFSGTIEPIKGVIQPNEECLMCLALESLRYSSHVSFSIPCDVINYSQLKEHEESVQIKEKLLKKAEECFVITEKGISHEVPTVEIVEKPRPHHIFIKVDANIVSSLNSHFKMTKSQQLTLTAENELENNFKSNILLSFPESVRFLLEKIIGEILESDHVVKRLEALRNSQDYVYEQIVPANIGKTIEQGARMKLTPAKNKVQKILAAEIEEILCANL